MGLITGPRTNFQAPGEVWSRRGSLLRALDRIFKLRGKYGLEDGAYYGPLAEFLSSGGSMVWRMGLLTAPRPTFQRPRECCFVDAADSHPRARCVAARADAVAPRPPPAPH